ncbi:MAG: hypothetical protein HY830_22540, partial [Actinobacteria bacterium]|nr:hypothetical protein [Actinomycetota bacterium]
MVERVCWQPVDDGGAVVDDGFDDLPVDPLGGQIRLTAVDLADCPSVEEEFQRAVAGARAEWLVDQWWADPVAARADWDAQLADLYARVAAEDRWDAVGRRAVLDGAPGLGSLVAV